MDALGEMLMVVEEKRRVFKQQQFSFIAALESSREQAHTRTQPVRTVREVQQYMIHNCSNSRDRRIFSLFLDIMDNLKSVVEIIESLASAQNQSSDALDTCRNILRPDYNFSQLQAHCPHNEVNLLSCHEAKKYAGVVSVIPATLDLINAVIWSLQQAGNKTADFTMPGHRNAEKMAVNVTEKPHMTTQYSKAAGGWKPAWRPPGCRRK